MSQQVRARQLRLAVLISGTGRSLKNMIDRIAAQTLSAQICVVISSSGSAKGLQYAEEEHIPIKIFERTSFGHLNDYSDAFFDVCRFHNVDYVVMAGFVKLLIIPDDFKNRVLNIHPSIIPSFCGKGYYGNIVHAKALEHGVKVSGCTVHFVDANYDSGPIIIQKAVDVYDDDTPDTLNDRVFAAECIAYPEAIQRLAEGRVTVKGRIVKIAKPPTEDSLNF